MKKYIQIFIAVVSVSTVLASCNCKKCTKDSEISVTVCQDGGSTDEYNDMVAAYESINYTCR